MDGDISDIGCREECVALATVARLSLARVHRTLGRCAWGRLLLTNTPDAARFHRWKWAAFLRGETNDTRSQRVRGGYPGTSVAAGSLPTIHLSNPGEYAMSDIITITGIVATTPRHVMTAENLPITSFRLASSQRRFDRAQQRWIDGDTNWYTVTTWRQAAVHAAGSIHKGERVIVTGKQHIREWKSGERTGTTVDIDADALGHDLTWGTTVFTRSVSTQVEKDDATDESETPIEGVAEEAPDDDDELDDDDDDDAEELDNEESPTLVAVPSANTLAPF